MRKKEIIEFQKNIIMELKKSNNDLHNICREVINMNKELLESIKIISETLSIKEESKIKNGIHIKSNPITKSNYSLESFDYVLKKALGTSRSFKHPQKITEKLLREYADGTITNAMFCEAVGCDRGALRQLVEKMYNLNPNDFNFRTERIRKNKEYNGGK